MSITASNNPFPSDPADPYQDKLDKGGFLGTADDLKQLILAGTTGVSGVSVTPASTPTGTGIKSWIAVEPGNYTNFGGVIVNANSYAVISRNAAGDFSISQTEVDLSDYAKAESVFLNPPCFVPYGNLSTLNDDYGTKKRVQIYQSFKSLKLYGFDNTKPHKINIIWNDTYNPTNHYFRLSIDSFNGSGWSSVFDSSAIEMADLGFQNDKVVVYNQLLGGKRVVAEIDLSLIPVNINYVFDGVEMVVSEKNFVNSDQLYTYGQDLGFDKNVKFNSVDSATVSTKNEFFNDNFVRYKSDISSLDFTDIAGYTRKLKYQAIKNVELYGFDKTKPMKISHFWVDSYNPSNRFYRLILKQWNGLVWETVADTTALEKSALGIVDGKPFVWNYKNQTKRFSITIDFSNLAVNDSLDFNTGEPDLVFSQKCFKNEPLNIFNANKRYFTSVRKATFAFIFDDLNDSDTLVFDIFRAYGFLPSFAIQTSRLNSLNVERYKDFYLNGCSILAHSVTHPAMFDSATITNEAVDTEMKNSKKAIEDYGMKVSGWVTPNSSLHIDFMPLMDKNFGYGFTGLNAGFWNQTVNPKKMNRYGLESEMAGHNIANVRSRIDTAIANKELLVFYSHELPSNYLNEDGTSFLNEQDLRDVLNYLKSKSDDNLCDVLSCDEAVAQYYSNPF